MKNAKKTFAILITLVLVVCCFAACGHSITEGTTLNPITLHYLRPVGMQKNELYEYNIVNSSEGIDFMCSSNYVLGPEANDNFIFQLDTDKFCNSKGDYDEDLVDTWTCDIMSNGKITKMDMMGSEGEVIGSMDCDGVAHIKEEYREKYVDRVVLYVVYKEEVYTALFIRGGM